MQTNNSLRDNKALNFIARQEDVAIMKNYILISIKNLTLFFLLPRYLNTTFLLIFLVL